LACKLDYYCHHLYFYFLIVALSSGEQQVIGSVQTIAAVMVVMAVEAGVPIVVANTTLLADSVNGV
jgi:hypothetical protein